MQKQLSVEVFRDAHAPEVDVTYAANGINLVNQITDNSLVITDTRRKIAITKNESPTIRATAIRWPAHPSTDIQLVLTNRSLDASSPHTPSSDFDDLLFGEVAGYAERNPHKSGGVAVISTLRDTLVEPQFTVAHELGHLFGLRYNDEGRHCEDNLCIMYPSSTPTVEYTRIPSSGLSGWLERQGYRKARYTPVESRVATSFCTPCEKQLAQRAFFILRHREGYFVPETWR